MIRRNSGIILAILVFSALLIAIVSVLIYGRVKVRAIRVPTGGMANTIVPGESLFVKRSIEKVERGDIVVFEWPKDPAVHYVSRVIGLPGETVSVKARHVYVDGKELPEQRAYVLPENYNEPAGALHEVSVEGMGPYRVYYHAPDATGAGPVAAVDETPFAASEPYRIPDNHYFVLGDNRDDSLDSRYWGTVPRAAIIGKATMIYWSSRKDSAGNEEMNWDRMFSKVK